MSTAGRTDTTHQELRRADDAEGAAFESTVAELRREVDQLDTEILAAVMRRSELARSIGRARTANGASRFVQKEQTDVLLRFDDLGQEGRTLAMVLLQLGGAGRRRTGH